MLDVLELDLTGKTVTTDALLTQRALAEFLHRHRAHFVFCVKANQPTLLADLECFFQHRTDPDLRERLQLQHRRLEPRAIWTTTHLNHYLSFPHVEQAFLIERTVIYKASGKRSVECACGVTSHSPHTASPNDSSHSIAATGASNPPTTSSTPHSTKTDAVSVLATALRTPLGSDASPSASSAPNPNPSPPRCENSSETFASSSIT